MSETNRNTVQKEVVERIVISACDHPTAETVFQRARAEVPNISLGTVYRILNRLAADGTIREIHVKDAPSVFDKTLEAHAHLVCRNCGAVVDVALDKDSLISLASDGCKHRISDAHVMFGGLCENCLKNE